MVTGAAQAQASVQGSTRADTQVESGRRLRGREEGIFINIIIIIIITCTLQNIAEGALLLCCTSLAWSSERSNPPRKTLKDAAIH
jgi:hypothetical protein